MYTIRECIPPKEEIEDFLAHDTGGMLWHSPSYAEFLAFAAGGEERMICAYEGEDLVGFFRYFRKEDSRLGVIHNSSPWFSSHGGCVVKNSVGVEVRSAILTRYAEILRAEVGLLCACISLSYFEFEHVDLYKSHLKNFFYEDRLSQVSLLPSKEEMPQDHLQFFPQKVRNMIRKSFRYDFELVSSNAPEDIDFLIDTHIDNMQSINGQHKDPRHIKELFRIFGTDLSLYIAKYESQPVAGLLWW